MFSIVISLIKIIGLSNSIIKEQIYERYSVDFRRTENVF